MGHLDRLETMSAPSTLADLSAHTPMMQQYLWVK